jgi:nucleoside-diphosphate-sugar epimerase
VGCFREPGPAPAEDAPYCEREVAGWPYYRSKIEAEQAARRLAGELGVELVILRPPVLLGPGDHRFRSSQHVARLLRGKVPFLIRGGMHYSDVRDVAAALLQAMERATVRPVYHLPGTICSVEDFYREVAVLAGRRPPRAVVPFRLAWLAATLTHRLGLSVLPEPRLLEMASHHWGLRSRYAEAELGYRSRPGAETLRATIDWLTAHHPELRGP